AAALLAALGGALPRPRGAALHLAARALALLGCLAAAALGAWALLRATPARLAWWPGLPGEPFALAVDPLAAPFVLLLGLAGAMSFAVPAPRGTRAGAGARLALHAALALALLAAFTARHALLFLFALQGAVVLAAALVAVNPASERNRRAAWVQLALGELAVAFLGAALFALVAHANSYRFEDLAAAFAALPAPSRDALAWAFTAGGAIALGLAPAHAAAPLSHAEAPEPAAALISGALPKLGLYGLLRFAWAMPGTPPAHWGEALMLLGGASALAGALRAALETDARRLLAWNSLQHAGFLALATGLAASLAGGGAPALAALALSAALVHAIGHAIAQALAVLAASGASPEAAPRDLDAPGGLAHRSPGAATAAFVAALSLGGLPMLSCFAGPWLAMQALVLGAVAHLEPLRLAGPLALGALALASTLGGTALVRLAGTLFLGRPRAPDTPPASAPAPGRVLFALAALPLATGLAAPALLAALRTSLVAMAPALSGGTPPPSSSFALVAPGGASVSPLGIALLVALFSALAALKTWWLAGPSRVLRRAPRWADGAAPESRPAPTSAAFTGPVRLAFAPALRAGARVAAFTSGAPPARIVHAIASHVRRVDARGFRADAALLLALTVALLLWAR
ncbi:MAG TPA: proton-conducting transporter membrane subunit, partial [Candidatus Acidoferrales bacterium]|nr:proton-conducting transporter membrane subunit [Candidatus Acidoferrales bacterium]